MPVKTIIHECRPFIIFHKTKALIQSKYFAPKIAVFENRIGEYLNIFEKRKRRKPRFAGQKTKIEFCKLPPR
jgi:hypothetical protein